MQSGVSHGICPVSHCQQAPISRTIFVQRGVVQYCIGAARLSSGARPLSRQCSQRPWLPSTDRHPHFPEHGGEPPEQAARTPDSDGWRGVPHHDTEQTDTERLGSKGHNVLLCCYERWLPPKYLIFCLFARVLDTLAKGSGKGGHPSRHALQNPPPHFSDTRRQPTILLQQCVQIPRILS